MKDLKEILTEAFLIKKHQKTDKDNTVADIKEINDYLHSRFWEFPEPDSKCYKIKYEIGKDKEGYYIDTEDGPSSTMHCRSNVLGNESFEFLFDKDIERFNTYDKRNCPKFRWRSHKGTISIEGWQQLKSLAGLPKEIDTLFISEIYKGPIDLEDRKIKKIRLYDCLTLSLSGNPNVDEITWLGSSGRKPSITFNCKNMHKE